MRTKKPHILISHPTGNANVRAAIKAFEDSDLIKGFHTTVAVNSKNKWLRLLPKSIKNELLRRKYDLNNSLIYKYPYRECGRMIFSKLGVKLFIKHEVGYFSVDRVYQSLDTKVARWLRAKKRTQLPNCVYAYEDGALETFETAKKLNILTCYDLPIGYWRAARNILGEEKRKRPDWASTLTGFIDSQTKLNRKDKEIELADYIFVASSFTKNTLEYYQSKLPQVYVVPYGFPKTVSHRVYTPIKNRKLKLLFVGGLSQRKGIAEILEAVDILKDNVELTLIGRKPVDNCVPLNEGLLKNRYIPSLPHLDVLAEMQNHDILLFPSLFEGFGLVVTEAMSQGTPVITTTHTCGGDIIKHNENGWLVKPGSTYHLVEQLKIIINNPELVEKNGKAAIETARNRPWRQYEIELAKKIEEVFLQSFDNE